MSYTFDLNAEAARSIRALDFWLQETIYDELDLVAADPSRLAVHGARPWGVHDFERKHDGRRHTVFIAIRPDHKRRVLEVFRIGTHTDPLVQD